MQVKLSCLLFFFFAATTCLFTQGIDRVKLVFVGDIMGHDSQIASAEIEKDLLYDYSPCFEFVEPILKEADLAIGNLEVTLPGKPPYKGYPRFRSPDDLALALRYAGFDMLVTANNHSNDAGKEGVLNTIVTLDEYNFYHTGTFPNQQLRKAYYPLLVYKNGFRLVFLNYTYGTNGLPTVPPTIVNLIDEAQIEADMSIARQLQGDAIIVMMHWGKEYHLDESKEQQALAKKLQDWGADLVIGAHPHVVQPIKNGTRALSNGKSKNTLVAYSLGNFISGQRRANTDGGLMLEVELTKDRTSQEVHINDHSYIPVWRYIEKEKGGKTTYRLLPISAFEQDAGDIIKMSAENRAAMKRFAKTTRANLNRFDSKERKLSLQKISPELYNAGGG